MSATSVLGIGQVAETATSFVEAIPLNQEEADLHPLVSGLDSFSIVIAALIGYIGVAIMAYGTFRAILQFLQSMYMHQRQLSRIRIELGKHLALGLEFFIGKDIIESVVHPTWDDLGKLGAIVLLRTVITVFLSRELKEVEEEIKVEREEMKLENVMAKRKAT